MEGYSPENKSKNPTARFTNYSPKSEIPKEPEQFGFAGVQKMNIIPFFRYGNEFLEVVISCAENSPTRSAIIQQKVELSLGSGFALFSGKRSRLTTRIRKTEPASEEAHDLFDDFSCIENSRKLTLFDSIEASFNDYYTTANDYLLLKRWEVMGQKFFEVVKLDSVNCLVATDKKDKRHIAYSQRWVSSVCDDDVSYYPLFPEFKKIKGVEYSVIHTKQRRTGRNVYGIPYSVSSLKYQLIEGKKPKMIKEAMDANFMLGAIISIINPNMSQKELDNLEQKLNDRFSASGTADKRKFLLHGVPDKECFGLDYKEVKSNEKYDYFKDVGDDAEKEIIKSEGWSKFLLSVTQSGKLGSTKEIENEMKRIGMSVINPTRQKVIGAYSKAWSAYCEWMGCKEHSYMQIADDNKFLTIDELETIYANEDLKTHFNLG